MKWLNKKEKWDKTALPSEYISQAMVWVHAHHSFFSLDEITH